MGDRADFAPRVDPLYSVNTVDEDQDEDEVEDDHEDRHTWSERERCWVYGVPDVGGDVDADGDGEVKSWLELAWLGLVGLVRVGLLPDAARWIPTYLVRMGTS